MTSLRITLIKTVCMLMLGGVMTCRSHVCVAQTFDLRYAPAPVDNPLKGLVPYSDAEVDLFPHSMEFGYLPYSALVKGYNQFDWRPLDRLLNLIASRGNQAIFRVFLEYPGQTKVIPQFLIDDGLVVTRWLNTNNSPPKYIETPNYEDPNLRRSLKNFIKALGRRYDGDPRIGFITAGLLGTWGEWHSYPRNELFASPTVQTEVLDAYEAAFLKTRILLRYPIGTATAAHASNSKRPFGYHDDSFAWATLHTGNPNDDWFFLTQMMQARTMNKWRAHPIGGEIRPEAWGIVFDQPPSDPQVQDFMECVEQTHASWVMDSGMFENPNPEARQRRAEECVRRMGYEFFVSRVSIAAPNQDQLPVSIRLENRGVAPFYYDWQPEIGLVRNGQLVFSRPTLGKLTGLQPGKRTWWRESLDVAGLDPGPYQIVIRVPNPMLNGRPVRFANQTQDQHLVQWLTLAQWIKR